MNELYQDSLRGGKENEKICFNVFNNVTGIRSELDIRSRRVDTSQCIDNHSRTICQRNEPDKVRSSGIEAEIDFSLNETFDGRPMFGRTIIGGLNVEF